MKKLYIFFDFIFSKYLKNSSNHFDKKLSEFPAFRSTYIKNLILCDINYFVKMSVTDALTVCVRTFFLTRNSKKVQNEFLYLKLLGMPNRQA